MPSNSELQVSIWRLTNDRQVWYEWHAESFISIPSTTIMNEELSLGQPFSGGFSASSFSAIGAPSPLLDSKEIPHLDTARLASYDRAAAPGGAANETVKIGHTSLHNPGGRSSWIGL